ncbi:MAG: hypothetical protein V1755_03640 [Chloroflexota bacterium]
MSTAVVMGKAMVVPGNGPAPCAPDKPFDSFECVRASTAGEPHTPVRCDVPSGRRPCQGASGGRCALAEADGFPVPGVQSDDLDIAVALRNELQDMQVANRLLLVALRRARLAEVDALEQALGINPRTSDLRKIGK